MSRCGPQETRQPVPDAMRQLPTRRWRALAAIAGICNRERNVAGLMPHPERAVESSLGSADGLVILRSMVQSLTRLPAAAGQSAERVSA